MTASTPSRPPLPELLAVARGERPADVVLRGARVADVFTNILHHADVALLGDRIAGLGEGYRGRREVDLSGRIVAPGLIDAHVHIESSMVTPAEFTRAVLPHGTTTVVSDPHEIANVHGLEGIRYMLEASEGLPLTVFVMASSCVPATPMSTTGAELDAGALSGLLEHPRVPGLGEVMNFPGAIHGDADVMAKLEAFRGRVVDGPAPGVSGRALNAYVAAGPRSDHECTTVAEVLEKLGRGLFVFFREATNARNLDALLPALNADTARRVALCTDDRQPPDLMDEGGIDAMVRRVMRAGHPPFRALRLATLNPAEYFGLDDRGAVAPGRRADLLVLAELDGLRIEAVWAGGAEVARDSECLWSPTGAGPRPPAPSRTVRSDSLEPEIPDEGGEVRVIRAIPDQIVTGQQILRPSIRDGRIVADPDRDLLKICVAERHRGSGRVGLGLVTGLGLSRGAIAGSVAHDHHNVIAVGADDISLRTAIEAVAAMGGGLAVAEGREVRAELDQLLEAAHELGTPLHDPFMAMSFLGLEVIPTLKITDHGLVDVEAFEPVGLRVEGEDDDVE